MSWFDASSFANLAKTALKEAQKTLDKALDITEEEASQNASNQSTSKELPATESPPPSTNEESKASSSNNTIWESFASSFFDKPKSPTAADTPDNAIPPQITDTIATSPPVITKEPVPEYSQPFKDRSGLRLACEPQQPLQQPQHEDKPTQDSSKDDSFVIRRQKKAASASNGNRLSMISNESDRKSTVSSDSVEVLGSTSTNTPDSEDTSPSKVRNSGSYESSVEILSSSSVEILNSEDPSRLQTEGTSSESVEIIPEIEEDDDKSLGGGADDTSASESTLTVLDLGPRSSLKDMIKSSSSMDTSITEVLSPWECGVNRIITELSEPPNESQEPSEPNSETKLPLKRTRNELSGTSITTLDSSSCDEGTMIGSSSDEAPKECASSVGSLKSMLADAINEQPDEWTARESSPTTSSMESRTENIKIGSSGHTSADELETATSSDIEVISSPNGDSSNANSRQSPAKLIYKNSKGHNREPSETSSGGSDDTIEVDRLLKEIAKLNEVLQARETKLIDLSMKNAELSESNSNLKSQLECQMSEEFTQRLAALEKKFQQAIREKELLRKQLENYKHLKDSSEFDEDKDQTIKELREEGEKLSKQELASKQLIKKLRATEKDHLKLISSLREQYDGLMQEVERAKKSLSAKEELERSQIEAINQLTKTNQKLDKQLASLQLQVDNLTSTLISSQKEIKDKDEKIAALEQRLKEAASLATRELVQKAETELKNEKAQREQLESVVANLQLTLQTKEMQYSERDDSARRENQRLHNLLEEYKRKCENASEDVLNATKTIAKQLEDEIAKYNAASASWEKQEKELCSIINEYQDRLKTFEKKERKWEDQKSALSEETKDLKAKLKAAQTKLDDKDNETKFAKKRYDLRVEQLDKMVEEKNEEIKNLKVKLEEAMKANSTIGETQSEGLRNINELYKDRSKLKLLLHGDASGNESDSDVSMVSPSPSPLPAEDINAWLSQLGGEDEAGPSSSGKGSVYETSSPKPIASAASTIEHLQTQYKLKEGEVQQLQWELKKHDHERIILTNEITLLASKVEELEKRVEANNELQTRYDTLLQMYGEKMEECQELRLDLEDVKEMYKIQIDELLTRSRTG
ncbi:TATA element modulatory factor isoform X2 [Planococcus citri]|uniref:TATA element modulatory factor isoform X2 n=1 Tax=Planococcus citri TaxID=170843 RepID=UPI0031F7FC05